MNKKIDLIVPVYKAHKTLFKLLCSIAQQERTEEVKVTLVNDCCPEGSYKNIIKRFKGSLDIQELKMPKNSGPGAARQYGIDHTDCPYIMFADADDTLFGCFVFNDFLNFIESSEEDVVFSSFIEQGESGKYAQHINDNIWVFGKIYRRSFLEKNNIRFTDLRANEDTCFNRKVMFTYFNEGKNLTFLDTFTYAWHSKQDSITAINNYQYSHDQSTCGFVDGMIEVFEWAEKQKIDEKILEKEIMGTIIFLYISYCDVGSSEETFQEQNFEYIKKYYNKVWKKHNLDYKNDEFISVYEENMSALYRGESQFSSKIFMAQPNIVQFMDMLENVPYDEENIYRIWDNLPEEVKQNNIKCGVCSKDFYARK